MERTLRCALALAFGLLAADGALGQAFGGAVALSGDQVLAGSVANTSTPGEIKVFTRLADGQWAESQSLSASDAANGDRFGRALAAQGDLAIAGATAADGNRGAAYVLARSGDGAWRQVQKLQPSDVADGDNFGRSVALDGNLLLVSTAGRNEGRGAVAVFTREDAGRFGFKGWLAVDTLAAQSLFGLSVALSDGLAAVSAPGSGAVFVYTVGEDGTWSPEGALREPSGAEGTNFGAALAVRDGLVYVGAPTFDENRGAVQVFGRTPEGWQPVGRLQPFDGDMAAFGAHLAFVGDELWVTGAIAAGFSGGVYRYLRDADGTPTGVLRFASAQSAGGRQFGMAVAGVDGRVVAGAPGDARGIGAVEIYEGNGHGLEQVALFEGEGPKRRESITGAKTRCTDGKAGDFSCKGYDMLSFVSIADLGGGRSTNLNDIWGWTDPETGREWALVGRTDGTSFVDVTDPSNPFVAGDLPLTPGAQPAAWRDIKVYKDHAFIVSDGAGQHGMQVFDLRRLRDVRQGRVQFEPTALYTRIASAHNVVINEETGFAYTVGNSMGGETCGGGYHIIDVRDPANPTMAGCWGHAGTGNAGTGYSHDAQCVIYRGPDPDHQGKEICLGSNETAISIADLTDKANPKPIAVAQYPNVAYTHQGWLTEDQRYFYVNDELDESSGKTDRTRTLVWDVTDLDEPELVKEFKGSTPAIDHNLYVKGDLMYQSNYSAGLRVIDISDPANPVEVGWFDVNPLGDATEFTGSWSNYPYFGSGTIIVTSIELGLFVVKKQDLDI